MIQNNKPLINIAKKEYRYNLIQNIIIGSIILSITILNTIISSISISMYKYLYFLYHHNFHQIVSLKIKFSITLIRDLNLLLRFETINAIINDILKFL